MFNQAIVRQPGANFAAGLTTAGLGAPDYQIALEQHERYCQALQQCALKLTRLSADPDYPDSTFVEDVAILTPRGAVLTYPGAPSRMGEVAAMRAVLPRWYMPLPAIEPPGKLDGGDICEVGEHFFIGISERTNEEGARQLAVFLGNLGYRSTPVDIRGIPGILHLKSGVAALDGRRLVVIDALAAQPAFRGYELVRVSPGEEYASNCVQVNDRVLVAAGFPVLKMTLCELGYQVLLLEMSEFQKMDGGLSCLSLRF